MYLNNLDLIMYIEHLASKSNGVLLSRYYWIMLQLIWQLHPAWYDFSTPYDIADKCYELDLITEKTYRKLKSGWNGLSI